MKAFLFGVMLTLFALIAGGYFLLKSGRVSFSADQQPSAVEEHVAMSAVDASTERNAPETKNPLAADEGNLVAGGKIFFDHFAGGHGGAGKPESQFGRSFNLQVPAFF